MCQLLEDEKKPLMPKRLRAPVYDDNTYEDSLGYPQEDGRTRRGRRSSCCPCISARIVLALLSSAGFLIIFSLRSNLSVAMVAMVYANVSDKNVNQSLECMPKYGNHTPMVPLTEGEFQWNGQIQGIILGSFYYGYCLTQIPGGWLAQYFGGKRLIGGAILVTSLLSLLSPIAARFNWWMLVGVRFLEGATQGVIYPAMHSMWGRWAPKSERSRLVTITYSGSGSGTTVGLIVSGYICQSQYIGGWPSCFYLFGGIGCVWFIIWMLLVHDLPADHPRISAEELHLLQTTTSTFHTDENNMSDLKKLKPPWTSIFTSSAVWAIVAAHVATDFGFFTLASCLPTYMKFVLKYNIDKDGILSAVPYMAVMVTTILTGLVADWIRDKKYLSTVATRKLMNTLGLLLPAGFMLGMGYTNCDSNLAVALLTLAIAVNGLTAAGYTCNHIDIAPKFSGILMGLTNTFGTTTGFIGPYIVGVLTDKNQSREQWQKFFFMVSALYGFGGLVFLVFAKGEEQKWSIEASVKQNSTKTLNIQK
ncbi:sialin [Patella vulgata]|uniref:sialin n=1 Tax=Patella vulgata TaxID=6465 RepID=UPI0024A9182D|nr:sialin [Patella vulgata]